MNRAIILALVFVLLVSITFAQDDEVDSTFGVVEG
jgi:hypothetical protein